MFRSALRRGSDEVSVSALRYVVCFDPRSGEGATLGHLLDPRLREVSIRAPARERLVTVIGHVPQHGFRSALRRGSDPTSPALPKPLTCFDPRSGEGATQAGQPVGRQRDVSIRAPARERRPHLRSLVRLRKSGRLREPDGGAGRRGRFPVPGGGSGRISRDLASREPCSPRTIASSSRPRSSRLAPAIGPDGIRAAAPSGGRHREPRQGPSLAKGSRPPPRLAAVPCAPCRRAERDGGLAKCRPIIKYRVLTIT